MKLIYKIKIYSFYSNYITMFIKKFNKYYNIKKRFIIHLIKLPTQLKKFTVLKSPHVNKKSKEQFKAKVHKAVFYIKKKKKI